MGPDCVALIARCGSKALAVQREAPAGLIFRTSLSPTFSCFMPGLTQVLTPQTDLPHGSTRIWVLQSARAQLPRYDGPLAGAALAAPIIRTAAMSPSKLRVIRALPTHRSLHAPSGWATRHRRRN
jgi:hypothetical protein